MFRPSTIIHHFHLRNTLVLTHATSHHGRLVVTIPRRCNAYTRIQTFSTSTTSTFNNLLTSNLEKGFVALITGELQSGQFKLDAAKAKMVTEDMMVRYGNLPVAKTNAEKLASLSLATYNALVSSSSASLSEQDATTFVSTVLSKSQWVAIKTNQVGKFLSFDKAKYARKGIDNFKKDNASALTFQDDVVHTCFYRDFLRQHGGGEKVLVAFCRAEQELLSQSFSTAPNIQVGMDSVVDGHVNCKIISRGC